MPRLLVTLILSLTTLAGFLTSVVLLHSGVTWMWLRYPLAISLAYGVFLFLLWLWLRLRRDIPDIDFPDINLGDLDFSSHQSTGSGLGSHFGGGRNFSGGGAGGSWGQNASVSSGGSSSPGFFPDLDLEEGWLIVLAVVALIGALLASLYVVYIAPALLAEILVDGALVAGLYKRVKRNQERHWLRAAVRQTVVPAVLVIVFFTVAGLALQKAVPGAHTIGQAWQMHKRHSDTDD